MNDLPAPIVESINGFRVVRDDLLPGGTKVRYLEPLVAKLPTETFIYASPAYGYAQIALAHAAKLHGKKAVIFVAKRNAMHPRTLEAKAAGAEIHEVEHGYLSVVQARARDYRRDYGGFLLPFGADLPDAVTAIADAARATGEHPTEVWACAGSGTLTRGLQQAWPDARHYAVRVGSKPNPGIAHVYEAPEKYQDNAKRPPPFPSCSNYDAKVWAFLEAHGSPGALFWNVAG